MRQARGNWDSASGAAIRAAVTSRATRGGCCASASDPRRRPLHGLLVDTGFLIAFGRRGDPLHSAADAFLRDYSGRLVTVAPVIVETCFFFAAEAKIRFLEWIQSGAVSVVEAGVEAYPELARILGRYADRDIDLADAALIWHANRTGLRSILTVDQTDFSVYRLADRRRFDLVDWM